MLFEKNKVLVICQVILLTVMLAEVSSTTILYKRPEAPVYNIAQSLLNAKYTSIAFCPKQCVQKWNCHVSKQLQFQDPVYLYNNLTQVAGYIGYRPDTKEIIVAWRGSSNKPNWWEDFNFEMLPYSKCKDCHVHAGFFLDYETLSSTVYSNLQKLAAKYPVTKITCTGHSLGAAIALIAGLQIKLRYGTKYSVHVHNFGQPRVGDINLAQFMKTKLDSLFRVIHNKDLVPHVPFQWLQYRHPATQIFFSQDMKTYKVCNDSGQDPDCSNKFYPNYDPNDHDFYFFPIDNSANCKVTQQ